RTRELAAAVDAIDGCSLKFSAPYFNEIVMCVHQPARHALAKLEQRGILGGVDLGRYYPEYDNCILMAATEMTTTRDIQILTKALHEVVHVHARV
ncbi:MAG TPA: hypothetical protein VFW34_00410, partial [Candidatus Rubrimentiphilum sp.]|nr:hypothetical protein [Candidatus Rubrimentiphilum sp.]